MAAGHMWPKARWAVAALQLAAAPLLAQGRGVEALVPAAPEGHVTDVAGVVDPASRTAMESLAARLRQATGAEIAVVTLPTIGDYAAVDVAVAIGREWGVGAKAAIGDERRNAGVVVLLVPRREGDPGSGQVFIATGSGLEGIVTDATAGRIRELMLPELREEAYGPGLLTGVRALTAVIADGFGLEDSTLVGRGRELLPERGPPRTALILLLVAALVVGIVIASAAASAPAAERGRRGRRRPGVYWGGGWGGGGFGGGFGGGGAGGRF